MKRNEIPAIKIFLRILQKKQLLAKKKKKKRREREEGRKEEREGKEKKKRREEQEEKHFRDLVTSHVQKRDHIRSLHLEN